MPQVTNRVAIGFRRAAAIVVVVATILTAPPVRAADLAQSTEEARFEQHFHELLWHDRTDELDVLAAQLRRDRARFDDGRWKLAILYWTVGRIPWDADDTKIADARARLAAWRAKHPDSPTPHIALAQLVIGEAWRARGHKFANEVTEEQWRGFHEKVHEAHQLLDSTKAVASACPGWYEAMQIVALMENWSPARTQQLFDEAVSHEPLYQPLYFNREQSLQPQWGGSLQQIAAFAERAAELTKATEGRSMYARVLWAGVQAEGTKPLEDGTFDWQKMKQGFRDLMERYPKSDRNLQAFARYAWAANDKATAAEIFKKLGDDWYSDIWGNRDRFEYARKWALDGK